VTDLWGNTVALNPSDNVVLVQVDAFPRFVDVGEEKTLTIAPAFARFRPAQVVLHDGGENKMHFELRNDQELFQGKITCELHFHRWPGDPVVRTVTVTPRPWDYANSDISLSIPEGAQKGQLYTVSVEILLGSRRIGYLTLPVWYQPGEAKKSE
jgi:hypothetical protein